MFRNGRYLGVRHQSTIEALLVRGLVDLEYNRKGFVIAAHERTVPLPSVAPEPKPKPLTKVPTPPPYSFETEDVDGRPWDLRRLDGRRSGVDYAPADVRPIFENIVRSCLRS